jgi:hypothetical protein
LILGRIYDFKVVNVEEMCCLRCDISTYLFVLRGIPGINISEINRRRNQISRKQVEMFQHILTLGLTLSNSVLPSKIEKPGKEGVGSESGNGIVEVDYTSICDECVPRAQIVAPAVGIELAATYG